MDFWTIAAIAEGVALIGGAFWAGRRERDLSAIADALEADRARGWQTLFALRDRCFITNEKGHRVRYVNASRAAREAAEKL